jgi:hypothetical protein
MLKIKPWPLTNGSLEAQNGAVKGLSTSGRRFHNFLIDEEQDLDPHFFESYFKVMRISNPG